MIYTLFIWGVAAMAGVGSTSYNNFKAEYEWKVLTKVSSADDCDRVAQELGLKKDRYRCIKTN